ncbi:MAG: hypothetical protein CM15mV89_0850 [Caudoviricetes sp.]|nr:MAG: hypothetical protein CM15mV89_0850 [Caudoviricetes sp.]
MFVSLIDGLDYGQAYFADDMGSTITVTVGVDTVAGQSTGVFYFDGVENQDHMPYQEVLSIPLINQTQLMLLMVVYIIH